MLRRQNGSRGRLVKSRRRQCEYSGHGLSQELISGIAKEIVMNVGHRNRFRLAGPVKQSLALHTRAIHKPSRLEFIIVPSFQKVPTPTFPGIADYPNYPKFCSLYSFYSLGSVNVSLSP